MNQSQVEEILSKLVPLTLELSSHLIQLEDDWKSRSLNPRQHAIVANMESIRMMSDELLVAYRGEE